MTLLDRTDGASPAAPAPPRVIGGRLRDLGLGIRFAASGGREGWVRTALTAVGVGLGVALLLIAASVPTLIDEREQRGTARAPVSSDEPAERSDRTLVWATADTEYRKDAISGALLRPDGAHPPLPPGVSRLPGPGDMLVSPALKELLDSPGGTLLEERLDYRTVGTIGDAGLIDPGELRFYAGSSTLTTDNGGTRTTGFGESPGSEPMSPVLIVLVILICVVLLVPVAIFIATAVRFGGDRRDRRLAALRLVGADARMTRRISAGEALFGSVLGLLVGIAVFAGVRRFAGHVQLWDLSAFPSDVVPVPVLGLLILLAVPVSAVAVTLVALRSVVIEPLGVVRNSTPRARRLWWRLLMPAAGLTVLLATGTVNEETEFVDPWPIAGGAVLVLVGLATLLPWVVEAVVGRLRGGPVPWQLATRRLQLSSGSAARAVSGITVAVAGGIALQMLFAGVHDDFNRVTNQDPERAQLQVSAEFPSGELAQRMIKEFRGTEGVKGVIGTVESYVHSPVPSRGTDFHPVTTLTVGDCATLRELARIGSCKDGDTFVVHVEGDRRQNDLIDSAARKGKPVDLNAHSSYDGSKPVLWTLPADTPTVTVRPDPTGREHYGIFATPGAVDVQRLPTADTQAMVQIDESVPDAREYVRNTAARIDPTMRVWSIQRIERDKQYASVQTGLLTGATATMALIAASMLVSQVEQLRERKRLLSVLVAFGTRRATLAWSVLWQTAVPVVLGTAVAIVGGLGLGAAMLRLTGKAVTEWWVFLPLAAAGAGVILLVTVLSLPPLWRMMRPEGLRTE
ncbi:ABC transporter permease [Streptomyces sp. NBC_01142]|uniref:FtsX-like permease family protein n=1 Tax=Streptomyces sp. NBC_01142 TaxID=2975865 RepID=UPI00225B7500|nr:FtsX-like permease family protein [Streptomyces sp. NBC_01142]MCX4819102.1 ABC transporter permease [Streptomyces sp. NBC_01142]